MIKISEDQFFSLYACCIPVKGAARSTVCDLQHNSFIFIPNSLCDILADEEVIDINEIENINESDLEPILEHLIKEDLGFLCNNPECFPKIDFTSDDFPEFLKNVIVDFDHNSSHPLPEISKQISQLRCTAVELRYFTEKTKEELLHDLDAFKNSTVRSIHLAVKHSDELISKVLNDLCLQKKRVKQIIVHGAPKNEVEEVDLSTRIIFSQEEITDETHCGNISPYYFQANIDFFKESLFYNNCLDRKIGIDRFGNIKNCPSMEKIFGHISKDKIEDILDEPQFQKLWNIRKDDIEVCCDCEFRYVCMDCRAYKPDEEDRYTKPEKCDYNPYTNEWE